MLSANAIDRSLVGFIRTRGAKCYMCNSMPNRRGLGCGCGVYVSQEEAEREVIRGLDRLLGVCTDRRGIRERSQR